MATVENVNIEINKKLVEENKRLNKRIEEDVYVKALRDTCDKLVLENERLKNLIKLRNDMDAVEQLQADKVELLVKLREAFSYVPSIDITLTKEILQLISKHDEK